MKYVLSFLFVTLFLCASAQDTLHQKQSLNSFKLQYEYSRLTEKISSPWQFSSIEYGYKFKKSPLLVRLNHARRNGTDGVQPEVDIYPKISKKIYSFINFGWSDNVLFPRYRAGASVYLSLPKSYEAEGGFRYLNFTKGIMIYTASLAKYYKKYWFNAGAFVSPAAGTVTNSVYIKTRYYKTDQDYFMITLGKGVSPDDKSRLNNITPLVKLNAFNAEGSMQKLLKNKMLLDVRVGWFKQDMSANNYTNRLSLVTGLTVKF